MASTGLQLIGFFLGLISFIGNTVVIFLPQWQRSAYIDSNIVTFVGYMRGLWMECTYHSTGIVQCEPYSSLLDMPADVQAARAMMIISGILFIFALIISVVGMKCTIFLGDSPVKDNLAAAGGGFFFAAGLMSIVPVTWHMHKIIVDFHNPSIHSSLKFEIGEALYLGTACSLLSIIGGAILCMSCSWKNTSSPYSSWSPPRPPVTRSSTVLRLDHITPLEMQHNRSACSDYILTGYV
ncbi:claudin-2 [Protopterus annectens]|uniref:claudin-2 n=1 Tax=Protopterus annectens TaxID=7888 RepID=UPI001CFBD595|nr:claudin-2 [Protopterus annectens]